MPIGFPQIDRTVSSSYEWLDGIAAQLGGERRDAYHALRAVLGTLRDRLPTDVAVELSAHMPLLVRGVFLDDYAPMRPPLRERNAMEFAAAVRGALAEASAIEPRQAIDAVFEALVRHLDRAALDALRPLLPAELRTRLDPPPSASGEDRRATPLAAPA